MSKPISEQKFYEALGQRLYAVRKYRKLSLGRVSAALDIRKADLQRCERGIYHLPIWDLVRLLNLLAMPAGFLGSLDAFMLEVSGQTRVTPNCTYCEGTRRVCNNCNAPAQFRACHLCN